MADSYVLGRTPAEARRLQLQGSVLAPHSAHLLRLAGITSGMRVLDVGCGAGDVSVLLAELVGPDGAVVGVDMDPAVLELARERTAASGLGNVSFVEADLAGLRLDEPFDALVGRLILLHLREPAATVRALSRLVRSGGVVSFQEFSMTLARSVPPTPLVTKTRDWIIGAYRAIGSDPDVGERVASILAEAGLSVEGAAAAGLAGTAGSVIPEYWVATLRSILPTSGTASTRWHERSQPCLSHKLKVVSCIVKTGPSMLTPFLRSDAQGAVLAETLLDPTTELTISEIARRAGVLPAVAHREVSRLVDADVLRDRREGNNRLVRANTEHPLWPLMSQIVVETYGPAPLLRNLLGELPGIREAYIYGSWAGRRVGQPGPPPHDIDVLVVGNPSRTDLLDVADAAQQQLHTEVNIHTTTPEAWAAKDQPFLMTVVSRPLITLVGPETASG